MIGTLINVAAILIGGAFGMLFGARLPERMRQTVIASLGLFTAIIGIQMTFESQQILVVLGSLLVGGLLGEWMGIEDRLSNLGAWLERRFTRGERDETLVPSKAQAEAESAEGTAPGNLAAVASPAHSTGRSGSRFIRGFLTASLVYAIGPIAILGAIQDGLTGDYSLLAIKSVLDGFASLAFASSLGIGVLFSSLVVFVYQGGLSLLAGQASAVISADMMAEMTAAGGVLLLGVAISSLLEIKPIRVGNLLPALVIAPLIIALLTALGIQWKM